MNFFAKFRPYKRQLIDFYLESLADVYRYGGVHNWEFSRSGITYRPQEWMVDFSINVLRKISKLGLNDRRIAKKMNSHNISNLLYAELAPWAADDVSLLLSITEGDLLPIN